MLSFKQYLFESAREIAPELQKLSSYDPEKGLLGIYPTAKVTVDPTTRKKRINLNDPYTSPFFGKEEITTTRRDILKQRGMGDSSYLDALRKRREENPLVDEKGNRVDLRLPSIDSKMLDKPLKIFAIDAWKDTTDKKGEQPKTILPGDKFLMAAGIDPKTKKWQSNDDLRSIQHVQLSINNIEHKLYGLQKQSFQNSFGTTLGAELFDYMNPGDEVVGPHQIDVMNNKPDRVTLGFINHEKPTKINILMHQKNPAVADYSDRPRGGKDINDVFYAPNFPGVTLELTDFSQDSLDSFKSTKAGLRWQPRNPKSMEATDVIGHESVHSMQFFDAENEYPYQAPDMKFRQVVGPPMEHGDYYFNSVEPAARAFEYKSIDTFNTGKPLSPNATDDEIDTFLKRNSDLIPDRDDAFFRTKLGRELLRQVRLNKNDSENRMA
jgi:hypothetical protein